MTEDNDRKRSLNPGRSNDDRRPFSRGRDGDARPSSDRPRREDTRNSDERGSSRPASGADRRSSPRSSDGERRSFSRPRSDDDRGSRPTSDRPSSGGTFSRGTRREDDNRGPRDSERSSYSRGPRRDDDSRDSRDSARPAYPRRDGDANDRSSSRRPERDGDSRSSRPAGFRGGRDDDRSRPQRGSLPQEGQYRPRREETGPKEWRPGLAPRADEPDTPTDVDLRTLPRQVRAELRGLPSELADKVGAHLVAAGMLIDEDPELAYRHAEAARRRASRLPIIREAAAETAYAAGDYAHALTEFRALKRMSGNPEYLHVMADCERALGRPDAALKLIREAQAARPDDVQAVELKLVEAGVRDDMGQKAEALRILKSSIEEFVDGPPVSQARLRFAYAEALLARGKEDVARKWLETAVRMDPEDESGAAERLAELDGLVLDLDFSGDEDDDAQDDDAQ